MRSVGFIRPSMLALAAAALLAGCSSNGNNNAPAPAPTRVQAAASSAAASPAAGSAATAAAKPPGTPAATAATSRPSASLAAATVSAAATLPPPPSKAETVHVDHVPLMNFAPLYVAIERGYFKEQGIEIDLQRVASGTEAMPFLAQGQIDVGAIGIASSTFNSVKRGFDVEIVASAAYFPDKNNPTVVLVRKELMDSGKVKTIADLKGKKVGVAGTAGSTGAYLLSKALETARLKPTDVDMQNLANPDMVTALANGAIDAALIGSPFSQQAVQAGSAVVLLSDWLPGASSTAYLYSAKFIKEHPETALRFMAALIKGSRAMQGDQYLSPENLAAYVKWTGSPEAAIKAASPLRYDPNLTVARESIADQERVDRDNGWSDYKDALDLGQLIDESFGQRAVSALGKP